MIVILWSWFFYIILINIGWKSQNNWDLVLSYLKGRGLLYLELSQFMLSKCSMYNESICISDYVYDCLENLKPRGPSPLSAGLLLSFAVARSISKKMHKSI